VTKTGLPGIFEQKCQYSEIIFVILSVIFILSLCTKKLTFRKNSFLFITYFLVLCSVCLIGVTSLRSADKARSFLEFCGIAYLFLSYFLFTQLIKSLGFWKRSVLVWNIVAVIVASIGFIAYLFFPSNEFILLRNVSPFLNSRMLSTFRHPNMLASYLHISIVFAIILLITQQENRRNRRIIFFLIIFLLAAILLTKSRILAGALLTLSLTVCKYRYNLFYSLRIPIFIVTLFFIIVAISTVIWYIFPLNFDFSKKNRPISLNLVPFPYYFYNSASISMIKEYPFFGVGIGMYNKNILQYVDINEIEKSFHVFEPEYRAGEQPHTLALKKEGMDPHSTFLGWAAETGLIGLSGILLFFSYLLIKLTNAFRRAGGQRRSVFWAAIAGLIGFLFNGIYIDILTMRHFWFLIAMISSFIALSSAEERPGYGCAE